MAKSPSRSPSPQNRESSPIPESLVLHIDNLTTNVNENHLREICGNFGEVIRVRITMDPAVDLLRGSGYVEFKTRADAEKAKLHMDGAQIDGKVVQAKFTLPERKKVSPPPESLAAGSWRDVAKNDDVGADAEKDNSSSSSLLPEDKMETEEDLLKAAIDELQDQEWKYTERIYRRGGLDVANRQSGCVIPAEQKEQEGSEQDDEEQIEERMLTDLKFRARYAMKAEEKILKLLFLRLSEHHKKLGNFLRTKAEPPIYYSFAKQLEEDPTSLEERKKLAFQEWKASKEKELSEYLELINEENVTNIGEVYRRWWNGRNTSTGNDVQETTDKEPETMDLEPMPKTMLNA